MSEPEPLDADALCAALRDQLIGNRVVVLPETTSTNDVVLQMAPESAEGLVVFAEKQTAGRGQYGRTWESASSRGLWLSVLLRPQIEVRESARLTDLLARTISATVDQQTNLRTAIKPPNDVYLSGKKIAGVLVEMRVEANGGYAAIAGIGINLNHTAEDFPPELQATASSLALSAGHQMDRRQFAIALLRGLNENYATFRARGSGREIPQRR